MNISCKTRTWSVANNKEQLIKTTWLDHRLRFNDADTYNHNVYHRWNEPHTLNLFNVCIATHLESVKCMGSHTPSINSMYG